MHEELAKALAASRTHKQAAAKLRKELDTHLKEAGQMGALRAENERLRAELEETKKDADELRANFRISVQEAEEARAEAAVHSGELGNARSTLEAVRVQLDEANRQGLTAQ